MLYSILATQDGSRSSQVRPGMRWRPHAGRFRWETKLRPDPGLVAARSEPELRFAEAELVPLSGDRNGPVKFAAVPADSTTSASIKSSPQQPTQTTGQDIPKANDICA